jgi:hypothetical protein
MNGIIKIVIIAAVSISIGGCSGSSSESVLNSPANGSTPNAANNAPLSNTNAGLIPYPGTENTNGSPAANGNVKVVNIDSTQLKPTNPAVPAPDNSEISTSLNQQGAVETRIFKSNPVLAKIEKTSFGKDVQLKLYLKNGRVIPLPAEKIKNFTTDSAAQILQVAGIQSPKPVQNVETGAATGTKTGDISETAANKPALESKPNAPRQTPNAPPLRVPTKP